VYRGWHVRTTEAHDRRVTSLPDSAPAPSAMRRVLRRARDGVSLNVDEATVLLHARGEDLTDL